MMSTVEISLMLPKNEKKMHNKHGKHNDGSRLLAYTECHEASAMYRFAFDIAQMSHPESFKRKIGNGDNENFKVKTKILGSFMSLFNNLREIEGIRGIVAQAEVARMSGKSFDVNRAFSEWLNGVTEHNATGDIIRISPGSSAHAADELMVALIRSDVPCCLHHNIVKLLCEDMYSALYMFYELGTIGTSLKKHDVKNIRMIIARL